MQSDQKVLSLRSGGGARGGSRGFGPRSDSAAAANFDLPLRPLGASVAPSFPSFKTGESQFEGHEWIRYTRDVLLQLKEVVNIIPEEILKVKQEIESELFGVDPSWNRAEKNNQSQDCYPDLDNRDWRNRSAQLRVPTEERSREIIRDRDYGS